MVLGDAQPSAGEIALAIALFLGAVALAGVVGALTAWLVARRREALPLGAMAMLAGTVVGSAFLGLAGLLVGVAASAGAGALVSGAGRRAEERQS